MTDEAAVLLRISVFGFVAGVIYWSLSYEPLGTAGFLLLGADPASPACTSWPPRTRRPSRSGTGCAAWPACPAPTPATPPTRGTRTMGSGPAPP